MSTPTTATPAGSSQTVMSIPFPIASRRMMRLSFSQSITLATGAPTPVTPIQLPAVGYLAALNIETILTTVAGATFTADAPFNVFQAVEFKTAAGNDIIVPLNGYQIYQLNKYGCQFSPSPTADMRIGRQFAATAPSAHFFMPIPLEIDAETGYGAVPALASNRSYQLQLTMAALLTVISSATSGTVQLNGTAYYWSEPPATAANGAPQQTEPIGLGTLSQWQLETPPITPGDRYVKSNNVGNVIRTLIFTIRNSAGARIDTNGVPAVSEFYVDNEPMFYLTANEWEDLMIKQLNLTAANKDTAGGLDTGVYVLPFHSLAGGYGGDPDNSRAQLLPTLDATQLQLRGTSFGSAVNTLEILTNSVIPTSSADLFSK